MGNDKEMMKEMLTVFLEDMPVEIEQIKMAYAQANYSDLKAPAHKLKSSVTWLGLDQLHTDLVFLENYALNGGEQTELDEVITRVGATADYALKEVSRKLAAEF